MKYTRILPLISAILVPFIATADPVVDDFATIPNLGATLDCKGGMLLASDGNYYGVAGGNGTAADKGTIFKMTPAGVTTTLVAFTGNGGAVPGNSPRGRLLEGPGGFLYGATIQGNNTGHVDPSYGTIFKVSKAGTFTSLVNFTRLVLPNETAATAYGGFPVGDLAIGTDGLIYGTTINGGASDKGTLWRLDPVSGAFASVVEFGSLGANAPVGSAAGLVRGSGNVFYGLGFDGGTSNAGCIFSYTPGTGYQHLASFTGILAPNYGSRPGATLVFGTDGKLYGTTTRSGVGTNDGTLFRCSTSGAFEHLADLNANAINRTIVGLALAPDGNCYGTGFNDRKIFRRECELHGGLLRGVE